MLKKIVVFQMSNVMFGFVSNALGSRNEGAAFALSPCQQCSLKQDLQNSGTSISSFCKLRRIVPHARHDVQFAVRRSESWLMVERALDIMICSWPEGNPSLTSNCQSIRSDYSGVKTHRKEKLLKLVYGKSATKRSSGTFGSLQPFHNLY